MNPNAESNIRIGRNTKDVDPEDQQCQQMDYLGPDTSRETTNTVESTEFGKFSCEKLFHKPIKWHLRCMLRERSSRKLLNFFLFGGPRLPVCLSGSGIPIGLRWHVLMWGRGSCEKGEIILDYCFGVNKPSETFHKLMRPSRVVDVI